MSAHDLHLIVRMILSQQLEEQGTRKFGKGVCRTGCDNGIVMGMDGTGGHVDDELW